MIEVESIYAGRFFASWVAVANVSSYSRRNCGNCKNVNSSENKRRNKRTDEAVFAVRTDDRCPGINVCKQETCSGFLQAVKCEGRGRGKEVALQSIVGQAAGIVSLAATAGQCGHLHLGPPTTPSIVSLKKQIHFSRSLHSYNVKIWTNAEISY